MKITIPKEVFLEKISYASRFISSKFSSLSILKGIYIKGEKNILHFYSTNLTYFCHSQLKVENNNRFDVVVEPKKIIEFLSLLSPGKIDFEIEKNKIIINQEKTRGEFPTLPYQDFPLPPKIEKKPQEINANFFLKNLPLVLFAASHDEGRPVLTGVNFVVEDEEMLIVATDGFRLSFLKIKKERQFSSMIVPANFLSEILYLIKDRKSILLNYLPEEKIVNFQAGEDDLYSRLIEGEYPPFENVIPRQANTIVTLEREEFLRNIKLISVFAREQSNIVIFETEKDGLIIKPKIEEGINNFTFQEAEVEGEKIKIAFNFKFLTDLFTHLDSKKIIMEFLRADAPAVFKADGYQNFFHIIMPVRLNE